MTANPFRIRLGHDKLYELFVSTLAWQRYYDFDDVVKAVVPDDILWREIRIDSEPSTDNLRR